MADQSAAIEEIAQAKEVPVRIGRVSLFVG
jgi:hypothetical protein